jgi:poly(A) polymerase
MNWKPKHPAFQALLTALCSEISPAYVVGGVVRDHLLGRDKGLTDLDVAVPHSAIPVARRVADRLGWAFYPMDEGRDVARLVFTAGSEPLVCDVARMRGGEINADLLARDFTINAMAIALEQGRGRGLVDVTHGVDDIAQRILRRVSAASLAEDPIRMVRAVRFMLDLDFTLEEETREQIRRMPGAVSLTSPERLRDELWKILCGATPDLAIEQLRKLGLLSAVLPETSAMVGVEQSAPHHLDVYNHTLLTMRNAVTLRDWAKGKNVTATKPAQISMLDALEPWKFYLRQHFAVAVAAGHSRADWLVWYALLHDWGKPETRSSEVQPTGSMRYRFLEHELRSAELTERRLSWLRFSRQEIDLATAVVRHHMRPHLLDASFSGQRVSRRAIYRFFRDTGGRQVDSPNGIDVLLLALADTLSIHRESPPPDWQGYLAHVGQMLNFVFTERGMERVRMQPLVDGHLLMQQLDLLPGRQLGQLIEQLAEAQAAGEISTRDEALALAAQLCAVI